MKESKNLTIRVSFNSQKNDIAENESIEIDKPAYQYHWPRIIAVMVIALVFIGSLVGAGLYYFDAQENTIAANNKTDLITTKKMLTAPEKPDTEIESSYTQNNQIESTEQLLNEELVTEGLKEKTTTIDSTANENALLTSNTTQLETETSEILEEENASIVIAQDEQHATIDTNLSELNNESTSINSNMSELEIEKNQIAKQENQITKQQNQITKQENSITKQENSIITASNTQNKINESTLSEIDNVTNELNNQVDNSNSTVEESDANLLFTQNKTEIFSDNITRFMLTQSIENNEPVGTLNDITFNENIATIFAFSEVKDLKDTTLYYLWSLDGKAIATVKIAVGGDRWRSYSSKFIQPNMHGKWKVELQNESKQTLAINEFSY